MSDTSCWTSSEAAVLALLPVERDMHRYAGRERYLVEYVVFLRIHSNHVTLFRSDWFSISSPQHRSDRDFCPANSGAHLANR